MSTEIQPRAETIAELKAIRAKFDNSASKAKGLAYQPAASDVFIATYPKCGTTWMQQILHCLRTGGDMAFAEITQVVPWLEMAAAMGANPAAKQRGKPKLFKTHLSYEEMPRGGRYVHVIRNPADVAVSMYHFHEGWFFEPGSIGIDDYIREVFLAGGRSGRFWEFAASWWAHRHDEDVHYLIYEDMLAAPARTVSGLAQFTGMPDDPALHTLTLERTSIGYMKTHESKFDDHLVRTVTNRFYKLPPDSTTTKVRSGRTGEGGSRLQAGTHELLDAAWQTVMGERFGLADYDALCAQARSELSSLASA